MTSGQFSGRRQLFVLRGIERAGFNVACLFFLKQKNIKRMVDSSDYICRMIELSRAVA